MRENTPIPANLVDAALAQCKIENVAAASIREIVKLVGIIEQTSGKQFIRMEMGVPGLPASSVGVEAEIEALKRGVASVYPSIEGIPILKQEASRFLKSFVDVQVSAQGCVPTVGSMQGGLALFMTLSRADARKTHTLFIDPGFPVQKQQHKILGIPFESFDVYEYRGDKLRDKLESYLSKGHISSILYSSPNNPSWICFTPKELQVIAEVANKYDVVVIEDQAYFGMDFRTDYSKPGVPPFPPSVAHYTDQYILLFSASKIFSYAGQRIGFLAVSDALYHRQYPDLSRFFASTELGHAMVYGALYGISSGTSHSAQYALAAMLKAANDGTLNFVESVASYGEKAAVMKALFLKYGFHVVYEKDEELPLADGFYFTIAYAGLSGGQLLRELLYYGISAISLDITGSERTEGLRACVSFARTEQFPEMEERLARFQADHS